MRRLKTILLTLMAMVPVVVFAQETTTEPPKEIKAPQKEKNKIPFKDKFILVVTWGCSSVMKLTLTFLLLLDISLLKK